MENISTENTDFVEVRELNDEELASVCGGLKLHLGVLPDFDPVPAEAPVGLAISVPPILE